MDRGRRVVGNFSSADLEGSTGHPAGATAVSPGLLRQDLPNPKVGPDLRLPHYNYYAGFSTAFALDYYACAIRSYYDDLNKWGETGYEPGEQWLSIGAWGQPYPWDNPQQLTYIEKIQTRLANRAWP